MGQDLIMFKREYDDKGRLIFGVKDVLWCKEYIRASFDDRGVPSFEGGLVKNDQLGDIDSFRRFTYMVSMGKYLVSIKNRGQDISVSYLMDVDVVMEKVRMQFSEAPEIIDNLVFD